MIVAAKHNQRRYIAVHGYSWEKEKAVHYMYLDNFGVWGTMVNAIYDYQFVFGVSLTKWEAYLMGGKSNQHGASTRYNTNGSFGYQVSMINHLATGTSGTPTTGGLRTMALTCSGTTTREPSPGYRRMQPCSGGVTSSRNFKTETYVT